MIVLTHLHYTDLIFDCVAFFSRLRLIEKLQADTLPVTDSDAFVTLSETTRAYWTNDFVVWARILCFDIRCLNNLCRDLTTVF